MNMRILVFVVATLLTGNLAGLSGATLVGTFGSPGTGDGQFDEPWGVAAAPDGTIYVGDEDNDRIQYFDASGNFLGKFGTSGSAPGEFDSPYYVTVTRNGMQVIVGDYRNDRLQVFTPTGGFLAEFPMTFRPNALVADASDNLWITDYVDDRIVVVSPAGVVLNTLVLDGSLDSPEGIAIFPDGRFAIANYEDDEVLILDAMGNLVTRFGSGGSNPGQLNGPTGVAVSADGRIFVVDTNNNRVQVFDGAGGFLDSFGTAGSGPGEFDSPQGIAILPNGRIYVADENNARIAIYSDTAALVLPSVTPAGKRKLKTKKSTFTLRGKATAGFGTLVKTVFVKVGNKTRAATGTGNWRFRARLKPGKNRVTIFGEDMLAQRSRVAKKVITREDKRKKKNAS